jgi:hypothetical protein
MSSVKQKKLQKNRTTGRRATTLYTHLLKNGIQVPLGTRLHLWVKIPEVLDADPDPGSGNLFDSGSGIQDHQVKKVRKTLIPTFFDLYEFYL